MQLIKFSNGKWGIRKGKWYQVKTYLWFESYKRGYFNLHWAKKEEQYFNDYCMTNEEHAREIFKSLKSALQNKQERFTDEVIE